MGVENLERFYRENCRRWEVDLMVLAKQGDEKDPVLGVDGPALAHYLWQRCSRNCDGVFGACLLAVRAELELFLNHFRETCGIRLILAFDGWTENSKNSKLSKYRRNLAKFALFEKQFRDCGLLLREELSADDWILKIFGAEIVSTTAIAEAFRLKFEALPKVDAWTLEDLRGLGLHGKAIKDFFERRKQVLRERFTPPLLIDCVREDAARFCEKDSYHSVLKLEGEADAELVRLGRSYKKRWLGVLSKDTDYLILGEDAYFFLPSLRRKGNATIVECWSAKRLCKRLTLSREHLKDLACLADNDYVDREDLEWLWLQKKPQTITAKFQRLADDIRAMRHVSPQALVDRGASANFLVIYEKARRHYDLSCLREERAPTEENEEPEVYYLYPLGFGAHGVCSSLRHLRAYYYRKPTFEVCADEKGNGLIGDPVLVQPKSFLQKKGDKLRRFIKIIFTGDELATDDAVKRAYEALDVARSTFGPETGDSAFFLAAAPRLVIPAFLKPKYALALLAATLLAKIVEPHAPGNHPPIPTASARKAEDLAAMAAAFEALMAATALLGALDYDLLENKTIASTVPNAPYAIALLRYFEKHDHLPDMIFAEKHHLAAFDHALATLLTASLLEASSHEARAILDKFKNTTTEETTVVAARTPVVNRRRNLRKKLRKNSSDAAVRAELATIDDDLAALTKRLLDVVNLDEKRTLSADLRRFGLSANLEARDDDPLLARALDALRAFELTTESDDDFEKRQDDAVPSLEQGSSSLTTETATLESVRCANVEALNAALESAAQPSRATRQRQREREDKQRAADKEKILRWERAMGKEKQELWDARKRHSALAREKKRNIFADMETFLDT